MHFCYANGEFVNDYGGMRFETMRSNSIIYFNGLQLKLIIANVLILIIEQNINMPRY